MTAFQKIQKLGLLLIAFAITVLTQAQQKNNPDSGNPFTGMSWRNIGPNRGGRSLGIAGSSKRKLEY
ncbi:hypothetical protein, partial [Klebsiella pneumoniae]|uniref:hypothetical protein n=1 Tax=Klebsiella pneumoniae TaxID=573 RepID=UPI001954D3A8